MPVVSQDADPRCDPHAGDHGPQGRRNDEGGHRECGQHREPGPVRLAPGCLSRPQHRRADEEDGAVFLHACRVDDTDRAHADDARQREPHHAAEAEVPRQEVDRGDGRDPRGQLRELGPPRTLGMQVDERPLQEVEPGCGEPHVPCRADSHPRRQGGPGVIAIEAEGRQPLHSHGGAGPDQDEEDDRRGPRGATAPAGRRQQRISRWATSSPRPHRVRSQARPWPPPFPSATVHYGSGPAGPDPAIVRWLTRC